ncbi:MAG: hypothetical protein ACON5B_13605 [Myxococcota bacterium]
MRCHLPVMVLTALAGCEGLGDCEFVSRAAVEVRVTAANGEPVPNLDVELEVPTGERFNCVEITTGRFWCGQDVVGSLVVIVKGGPDGPVTLDIEVPGVVCPEETVTVDLEV